MTTLRDITDAIADRISQARGEIASLEAARAVLTEPDAPARSATKQSSARPRRAGDLVPGQLEDLLRDSENGLSLVALAAQADVSDAKVRARLHELQRQGQVRNSGSRRTSLWRLMSDEDRIAARAAELESASGTRAGAAA